MDSKLPRRDLEQRGPGEVLGTRQTGTQQFAYSRTWYAMKNYCPKWPKVAEQLLRDYPETGATAD